ncbi:MAG: tetraacyldisaccharide 4'-kinase [Alphaproteobacteria bacterium]|nr:tetraacyldisaccharide 4'-kinase [Alphaproteobacteria bacterium]
MPRLRTASSLLAKGSFDGQGLGLLRPLLWSLSLLWQAATWLRRRLVKPAELPLPLIAVGNASVGGQGKTPTVLAVAELLRSEFRSDEIFCLSRGYGGEFIGPVEVIPALHTAQLVGDEPLLLSAQFRTIVSRFRPSGALLAHRSGARIIVMDDGLQNPNIRPDLAILVIDGGSNSRNLGIIPNGPMREPLGTALRRVQAVVLIGEDTGNWNRIIASLAPQVPIFAASLVPTPESLQQVAGSRIIPFAGIGRPQKFFDTLSRTAAETVKAYSFPDHHLYQPAEIAKLQQEASDHQARLVTTTKDYYRLTPELRHKITPFAVVLEIQERSRLVSMIIKIAGKAETNEAN